MILTNELAKQLLNLNPSGFVDQKIADRQFEVIVKSFNALQNGQSFIYIADEVGLGKTYIALGIISLLRHFSKNPSTYKDLIIVPKRNLQDKWQKEISKFVENNYLFLDNRVKSVIGKAVGRSGVDELHHKLLLIENEYPSYHIFRNSSFSMAIHQDGEDQWKTKFEQFKNTENHHIIANKEIDYKRDNGDYLRRLYAYMLNINMPCFDTIIIDEAHNFKHGIEGEVSQRNQVMSRLMGVIQNEEVDDKIFSEFPGLRNKIRPLAKHVIFLSATPINTSMIEMKNQFDVFLPNHRYNNINSESCIQDLENDLSKFLIRGVMNIDVNKKTYSRNMYRHEHRQGNVVMKYPNPALISLDNAKSAILTGLMQYKIMKELDRKNNKSFEIGLLSGFESFSARPKGIDQDSEKDDSQKRETIDQYLISDLANDYQQHFKTTIPHPKMDVLVDELFNDLLRGDKSLVFVRRIASVKELEQKLSLKYSNHIIDLIKKHSPKNKPKIRLILDEYEDLKDTKKVETILRMIAEKISRSRHFKATLGNTATNNFENSDDNNIAFQQKVNKIIQMENGDLSKKYLSKKEINTIKNKVLTELIYFYLNELNEKFIDEEDDIKWREIESDLQNYQILIRKNLNRHKRLDRDLTDVSARLVLHTYNLIDRDNAEEESENNEFEEDARQSAKSISSFFFTQFMRNKGKAFKKASYKKPWFELNYLHILNFSKSFGIDVLNIENPPPYRENESEAKVFRAHQLLVKKSINAKPYSMIDMTKIPEQFKIRTFLTDLLTKHCEKEFKGFVSRLLTKQDVGKFLGNIEMLEEILKGVFRNGSGALPAYLAWAWEEKNISQKLYKILKQEYQNAFHYVLNEIKTILNDFEKIVAVNFPDNGKVHGLLLNQLPVQGVSGYHKINVSKVASQFRMPGWPLVLIATDILKEGEDLHTYCSKVYHYGIAWNPSDMEQRTGRIDRIGSKLYHQIHNLRVEEIPFEKKLQVFFPYIQDSFEVIQVAKVFDGMNRFIRTFYDFTNTVAIENHAKTNDNIVSIPEQITSKLESKYDVNNFECVPADSEEILLKPVIGFSLDQLHDKLRELYNGIESTHVDKENEWISPDMNNLKITGMIFYEDENGIESYSQRHCPFSIKIINGDQPGDFKWRFESPINIDSKTNDSTNKSNKILKDYGVYLEKFNDYYIAYNDLNIDHNIDHAILVFENLVFNADKIEQMESVDDWTDYQSLIQK